MPRTAPDAELLKRVASLIEACSGSQSKAARRMGVERLDVNRLLKQDGRVTGARRNRLWAGLERAIGVPIDEMRPIKTLQEIQDIPKIAIQVIQLVAEAVEKRYGRGSAANDR
jgi:DNA transposition AAA+ family ATPase